MAEAKTKRTDESVEAFLDTIQDEKKRRDSYAILGLMKQASGEDPKMWGSSIIGFGSYRYKYASGHEGDWPLAGFSPRKQNLTLYITSGFDHYGELLGRLGKFKTGKACLYINKLEDVNQDILTELVKESIEHMKKTNP